MFQWSWILGQIDALTMNFGSPLVELGNLELPALGACVFLICCGKWALYGTEDAIGGMVKFISLYIVAYTMLHYFNQPAWFLDGNDFKHAIPDAATYVADIIEQSRYDEAMKRIGYLYDHLEKPNLNLLHGTIDAQAIIAYAIVEVSAIFLGSFLMIPIGLSFIFLGIGVLLWPVFIPFMIVPGVTWLFWNPLNFVIKYSFYRVFAVALTFIMAGVAAQMIDSALVLDLHTQIAGVDVQQYSLAQFTGLVLMGFIFLNVMIILTIVELPNVLRDYFGGGAGAGSNVIGTIAGVVR
jgi:hypothetical protein